MLSIECLKITYIYINSFGNAQLLYEKNRPLGHIDIMFGYNCSTCVVTITVLQHVQVYTYITCIYVVFRTNMIYTFVLQCVWLVHHIMYHVSYTRDEQGYPRYVQGNNSCVWNLLHSLNTVSLPHVYLTFVHWHIYLKHSGVGSYH
jgi:DNA-directed RNA polymerase subunit RPC12/RpoP